MVSTPRLAIQQAIYSMHLSTTSPGELVRQDQYERQSARAQQKSQLGDAMRLISQAKEQAALANDKPSWLLADRYEESIAKIVSVTNVHERRSKLLMPFRKAVYALEAALAGSEEALREYRRQMAPLKRRDGILGSKGARRFARASAGFEAAYAESDQLGRIAISNLPGEGGFASESTPEQDSRFAADVEAAVAKAGATSATN